VWDQGEALEDAEDARRRGGVEARRRLVEEEYAAVHGETERDGVKGRLSMVAPPGDVLSSEVCDRQG
jgi:hypothetical protein